MFLTFTKIDGKSCKVIVDRDIKINVVSSTTIEKFDLIVIDHHLPYKVTRIDNNIYEVKHKCLIFLDYNVYKANIWCEESGSHSSKYNIVI